MKHNILVVEDVDEMREALVVFVNGIAGLRVSGSARTTWEARLEIRKNRPDLVLLDEILPGESSLDLLHELHAEGIPVVLLTSLEHPSPKIPEGASGRLIKPGWKTKQEDRSRFESLLYSLLDGLD